MSGGGKLKKFFSNSRVEKSFSGGDASNRVRPGVRAIMAAGFLLMSSAVSNAVAQEGHMADQVLQGKEQVEEHVVQPQMTNGPLASWSQLLLENCEMVKPRDAAGQAGADPGASSKATSWGKRILKTLNQSGLGQVLHDVAAQNEIIVCRSNDGAAAEMTNVGPSRILMINPDFSFHPALGKIGDEGAAYLMALKLRVFQQQKLGNAPTTDMQIQDALLAGRLMQADAALYLAELALDLKYNHGDETLYNGIGALMRVSTHAAMSADMVSTMERFALENQPENVVDSTGGDSTPTLKKMTLTNQMRRAALDKALLEGKHAESFDDIVLSGFEAYLELPARFRTKGQESSRIVSDRDLTRIGVRPDDVSAETYLTGGKNLRGADYLKTTSISNARRLAAIIMGLAGYHGPDHPKIKAEDKKVRTFTAGHQI